MCTFDTDKIYLTWKKDFEGTRYIIGVLEYLNGNYIFSYDKLTCKKAENDGFKFYPAFQDLEEIYDKNVLEIFSRRLLNPQRRDYADFLAYWKAEKYEGNIFALLGLTGAKLLTDSFEFIAPHEEIPAKFLTNISWLKLADSKTIDEVKRLNNSELEDELSLVQEKTCKYNPKAIRVMYKNNQLGYIKSIHCENIYDAIEQNYKVSLKVKNVIKNGTIKEILLEIEIV